MNAIEMQMISLFEMEAKPVAEKYGLVLNIDWDKGAVLFLCVDIPPDEILQNFLCEMTAIIQKYPVFQMGG